MFNKNFYKILFTFILCAFTSNAADFPKTSIGVLDMNKILTDSTAAKKAAEDIEEIAKKIEEELLKSDEEMIVEQNKLIEAQTIMAPEAFEDKRNEYEKKVQNYNNERQRKLLSVDNLVQNSRNIILENMKPILEEIAENKGITILLEKNTTLLNADGMDITNEVIKKLNKLLPKIDVSLEN